MAAVTRLAARVEPETLPFSAGVGTDGGKRVAPVMWSPSERGVEANS